MKKYALIFSFIFTILLFCSEKETIDKIKKYSGKNSKELRELYSQKENGEYIKFILDNSSPNDLAVLTSEYIKKNINMAVKSKAIKYAGLYDENIFKHFVLPLRITQEPFDDWRERFYKELFPLVKDVSDIEEAAILVNIWTEEQMTYKSTHGKDQSPLTTIKRGYGRCEEMMIIYMAAARSVGIPVRSAGTPLWNFTDSNHAWVEVWTPTGWKYLGAAESADQLNKTWFTKTTERASIITSMGFGLYNGEDVIEQKNNSTEISSIKYYTKEWNKCTISIEDEECSPVENAKVIFYAVSWGGIVPMQELISDKNGKVIIPLGKGSIFISAYEKDKGYGYSLFNTLDGKKDVKISINKSNTIPDTNLTFKFQIVSTDNDQKKESKKYFEGKFDLMKERASLKRKDRLNNFRNTAEFASYFLKSRNYESNDKFYSSEKEFLNKCDILGENTKEFIKVYNSIDKCSKKEQKQKYKILTDIIQNWDAKELCEIPDSAAIKDLVEILFEGYEKLKKNIPDTVFVQNVISPTWTGGQVVQNGWQKEFYDLIKDLSKPNIKSTVNDVISWVDSKVTVDSGFVFYYYSCPLNPLEIINMNSVPEYYRTKLIDSALKILGIPTRWKGQLEYYNGKKFVVLEKEDNKNEEMVKDKNLRLSLYADGKQIKAEPWNNFQISEFSDGELNYYYFDGKNDSLDFIISYPENKDKKIYIQAGVRNTNGDANISIKAINQDEDSIRIDVTTPKEYIDISTELKSEDKDLVKTYITDLNLIGNKILMIRGVVSNEPTVKMTSLLIDKAQNFKENNTNLVIYTELRDDNDIIETSGVLKKKGDFLIPEIEDKSYPIIILFNEKNEIIFASKGYNMNIGDLLLKKVKKN